MNLTIDFETRSKINLKDVGAWKYAADPTTEVMCLALKCDDDPAHIYVPNEEWEQLARREGLAVVSANAVYEAIVSADKIEAHNAHFEIAIWHHKVAGSFFPDLDTNKVYCSMAKAYRLGLPGSLNQLAKAIDAPVKKDEAGHRLMMQMCKPRDPTEKNPAVWWETEDRLVKLFRYCLNDVESEHACSQLLPELPPDERALWLHDLEVNRRGITIDVPTVKALTGTVKAEEERLLGEVKKLTGGVVISPRQRNATLSWLRAQGAALPKLTKDVVAEALGTELPPRVKQMLLLRQQLSKTSTAKLDKMIHMADTDGRARGLLQYHAASTGRWGGRGIQVQNLPRKKVPSPDFAAALVQDNPDLVELMYGDRIEFASCMIRSCLTAAPGCDLICADYSSIEGRLLAWLASEEWVLEAYKREEDLYRHSAAAIFDTTYEQVGDPSDERQVGKVAELALGYGGGKGAFITMGANYGVDLPEEQVQKIVKAWRAKRPATTKFWYDSEDAAMRAVRTGRSYCVNGCVFETNKQFLTIRLPSGRALWYLFPEIKQMKTSWGQMKDTLTYMGMDDRRQWVRLKTWGGKIVENITQGAARDVLAAGIIRVEKAGYPVLLHVHDEAVSEVAEGQGSLSEYEELLAANPCWCPDLPLTAKGWRGKRYRK